VAVQNFMMALLIKDRSKILRSRLHSSLTMGKVLHSFVMGKVCKAQLSSDIAK
jgi:hypothetical protein